MTKRIRKAYKDKFEAKSWENMELVLKAVKERGSIEMARQLSGMTKQDFELLSKQYPEWIADLEKAKAEHAKGLGEHAERMALMTKDTKSILALAEMLHPEIYVAPKARAKAKAEASVQNHNTQFNVNVLFAQLGERVRELQMSAGQDQASPVLPAPEPDDANPEP